MAGLFVTDITPEQVANARKWIDALRSGKYKQGRWHLRNTGKYCCLGVGCDVLGANWRRLGPYSLLPPREQQSLGLIHPGGRRSGLPSLSYLNDSEHRTFTQIADVIEAELALVVEVTA